MDLGVMSIKSWPRSLHRSQTGCYLVSYLGHILFFRWSIFIYFGMNFLIWCAIRIYKEWKREKKVFGIDKRQFLNNVNYIYAILLAGYVNCGEKKREGISKKRKEMEKERKLNAWLILTTSQTINSCFMHKS